MANDSSTNVLLANQLAKDRMRRRRDGILAISLIVIIALLTFIENRVINFGADFPVSNTILMFILININLLLFILLIFLVFRNLVKLIYDRKRKVMGTRLRTRLVVAFITLTLVPSMVLYFFSINFITNSIAFWFNVPVEKALENSLNVGQSFYQHVDQNNRFFLERIAYQIKNKNLLVPDSTRALSRYIQIVQRAFNFHAVEVYDAQFNRITFAVSQQLQNLPLATVSAGNLQKDMGAKQVRTISKQTDAGELVRTFCLVPFGAERSEAEAYVVVSILIPPDLSENMTSIARGFEEYQQIKLLKKPIQITYYITLSIVALLVVFCAIWFGFYLAKSISIPIMELADGTRRVAEGDLDVRIDPVADSDIGGLVEAFNRMTRDLQDSRSQLELSAQQLQRQNAEIEEKRQYMEIVLKKVSAGVITLDPHGTITTVNTAAEKMLNLNASQIVTRSYRQLLSGPHLALARDVIKTFIESPNDVMELPLRLTLDGRPRSFQVHINRLKDESGQSMGMVMVVDDLTELEKAQRMVAWREVARRIAHEVKNPLTPISLSAQRLKRRFSSQLNEDIFDECTQVIIDHVDLIRNLVNEFSAFAKFPTANPEPCELAPIIEETAALYREGHPNIKLVTNIAENIPDLSLDRQQVKQALINLVDNAVAAMKGNGNITFTVTQDPILKMVRIEVADDGPGISDEDKTRLFEPNFSTKKGGMGLGLTIVSTIVADHNGMIQVQDNVPRGAKFVIELPAETRPNAA